MKTRLTEQTDILKKVLIHLNFCEMSHASTKHLKLTNPRFEFDWFSLKKWHPVMLVRFFLPPEICTRLHMTQTPDYFGGLIRSNDEGKMAEGDQTILMEIYWRNIYGIWWGPCNTCIKMMKLKHLSLYFKCGIRYILISCNRHCKTYRSCSHFLHCHI